MNTAVTQQAIKSGRSSQGFAGFLDALGRGFRAYAEQRSRSAEINALNALTDEQLAAKGLRREDIPYHVFRDLFYV
ncbi:hypothetical protein [Seohaeicola zhoushanensis]|uniref:DUF1127 domain-containing protein n=1 Tax=Seohaeicola zhoushanensis TaxID=1569283 RepID=A0A8J3GVW5_9RHOB|nr:hypothetical protein [Seohaeicola zhoushanensis]GHF40947.1 hypothetical protein GCM10017056_10690 [Seohaeicola zhoushanensis]